MCWPFFYWCNMATLSFVALFVSMGQILEWIQVTWVQLQVRVIVLCSWRRHLKTSLSLFTSKFVLIWKDYFWCPYETLIQHEPTYRESNIPTIILKATAPGTAPLYKWFIFFSLLYIITHIFHLKSWTLERSFITHCHVVPQNPFPLLPLQSRTSVANINY